jgi:hypothetical protein
VEGSAGRGNFRNDGDVFRVCLTYDGPGLTGTCSGFL